MNTATKIEQFFAKYESLVIKPKETFLHAGDEPKGVHFLEKGHVRQYDISGRTGTELTLHIFKPGTFFPLTWALNGIDNRYFYQAIEEVTVRIAPHHDVEQFLKANPEVLFDLTKRLLSGLDGIILRLQNQVFGDAYSRTLSELVYLARHFGRKEGKEVFLKEYFTHQDMADLTGSVRETVSVAIEKLKSRKLIRYEGHTIIINDLDQLEAELQKLL